MLATVALVFGPMLVEARRAAVNERAQRTRGGVEPSGDVYALMQYAYPAAFLAMIAEGAFAGALAAVAPGAALFAAAKALKWWAILTLGSAWTFRVIVVPGAALVRSGPYRWMRHPNYVGVVGELVGIALVTGARITGPLATFAFAVLIAKRIAIERQALDGILPPATASQPHHRA